MQTRRLFFALWPITKVIHDIKLNNRTLKQSLSGNFVAQTNWHVTLAFLGNVAFETESCPQNCISNQEERTSFYRHYCEDMELG